MDLCIIGPLKDLFISSSIYTHLSNFAWLSLEVTASHGHLSWRLNRPVPSSYYLIKGVIIIVVVIHHHKLYYATDSVPSILQMFTHLLLIITLHEVRSLTPIYKPGRLREPKLLALGTQTSKWWRRDKNSGILAAGLMLPNTTSVLSLQILPVTFVSFSWFTWASSTLPTLWVLCGHRPYLPNGYLS